MRELWQDLGMQERFFVVGIGVAILAIVLMVGLLEPEHPRMDNERVAEIAREYTKGK